MQLPGSWNLPDTIQKRLGHRGSGKQRAILSEGHLLMVLHKVPKPGDRKRQGVFFWRNPKGKWEYSEGGMGLHYLTLHLQAYQSAEEKLSAAYEKAQDSEDYFAILEVLTPLQMAASNLYSTLQSAREGVPEDIDIIDVRDWAYDISRTLDLLYLNTKNALDFDIAKKADEQARLSQRLNTLAAIFFPLTAISCVFGMNLSSGLESSSSFPFWVIFFMAIASGFIVRKWVVTGELSPRTFQELSQDLKRVVQDINKKIN